MARRSASADLAARARVPVLAAAAAGAAGTVLYERRAARRRREEQLRFRLRRDQPLPDELRRVLDGRLQATIDDLAGRGDDPDEAIHGARKSLKRLRTVVRLCRDQLGENRYHAENAALREAGRALAATRDAAALPEVLEALVADHEDEVDADELAACRRKLAVAGEQARARLDGPDNPADKALVTLRATRSRLDDWPLSGIDDSALVVGVRRAYRRGRRGYRRATRDPTTENLHAWRKRAKDLRYAAELLRDADPKRLKTMRKQARELSDALGDDHDLAVLGAEVDADGTIARLIRRRRRRLQRSAFQIGEQLYDRSPTKVVKRLRRRADHRTVWS